MKLTKEDKVLIEEAKKAVVRAGPVNLIDTGNVGAALITSKGNIFSGVSLGFYCGIASCGEYQAIGAMISNGEKEIKKIAAVMLNEKTGKYRVVPPCGKCREMMMQACKKNHKTEVVVSSSRKELLKDLLPFGWGGYLEK